MQCRRIQPGLAAFDRAARDLVRPHEVAHIVRRPLGIEDLAAWLEDSRRSGALRYRPDPEPDVDRWCSPAAMLSERAGDCDDFAVLAASLARAGGMRAHIVVGWRWRAARREAHAWVEGEDAQGPWWLECTTGRWGRDRPSDYERAAVLGKEG